MKLGNDTNGNPLDVNRAINRILYQVTNQVEIALFNNEDKVYGTKLMNCLIDTMLKHGVSSKQVRAGIAGFFERNPTTDEEIAGVNSQEMKVYYTEMRRVKNVCNELLDSFLEVSKNSRIFSEVRRDANHPASKLPHEVADHIVAETRKHGTDINEAEKIARDYRGKPDKK